jgi:hypothetical protein
MMRILATLGVATVALLIAASAAADQTYPDPSGDAGGGPDLTSVSVGALPGGLVGFQVTTKDAIAANQAILILIDADKDATTGFQGAEYGMYAGAPQPSSCGCGAGTATFTKFAAWNGSALVETRTPGFQVSMVAANELQLLIGMPDIGSPTSFRFAAIGLNIQSPDTDLDRAPNSGWYTYTPGSTTTSTAVSLAAPRVRSSGLHAGKPFTIAAHVSRSAKEATVTCLASIAGKLVRESGRLAAYTASCSGTLPAGSAGKRLVGTITVTISGRRASRRFAFRILPT